MRLPSMDGLHPRLEALSCGSPCPHRDADEPAHPAPHAAEVRALAFVSTLLMLARGEGAPPLQDLLAQQVAAMVNGGCLVRFARDGRLAPVAVWHTDAMARDAWQALLASRPAVFSDYDAFSRQLQRRRSAVRMPGVRADQLRLWVTKTVADLFIGLGLRSLVVAPCVAPTREVVGSLTVWRDGEAEPLSEDDLTFVECVAQRVGAELACCI